MLALTVARTGAGADEEVYLEPAEFVSRAFDGAPPAPAKLWVKGELRSRIRDLLGTNLSGLRQRYWKAGTRSVWILEAIGRDRPITAGYVVEDGEVAKVEILVYRESRGWEVRYPFFTDQFRGARLTDTLSLDRHIDGITGATLSVRAISALANVALLLDREARTMMP